jgi:RNase H-like domain found in reverse transcriptase
MWEGRSDTLALLASLTSKTSKWKWTEAKSKTFQKMKTIVAREILLAYPNFLLPFKIHTDASHLQLGVVILQQEKPIAFYSRKFNPPQIRYTTTERELLSIVETLNEFRNIFLGYPLIDYTDHKNLMCKKFSTERVMRWCLLLEKFGPELRYIQQEHNIVADVLSRLDITENGPYEQPRLAS